LTSATKAARPRLPRGWHHRNGLPWCDRCWGDHFERRVIRVPIRRVLDREWRDFAAEMQQSITHVTALANWYVRELIAADHVRMPIDSKLPPLGAVYRYNEGRACFPDLAPQTVVCVMQSVLRRYLKRRYNVVWLRNEAPPSFRYDLPLPIHVQSWQPLRIEADRAIRARIGVGWWTLILDRRHQFEGQLKHFDGLIHGECQPCELSIRARPRKQFMAYIVAWTPKPAAAKDRTRIIHVRFAADHFLLAESAGHEPWILNGDHVRRGEAMRKRVDRHREFLGRLSEDIKYEKRWPKARKQQILETLDRRCQKQHDRLTLWLHETSTALANFAIRQQALVVILDLEDHGYLQRWPKNRWVNLLEYKLAKYGITLSKATPTASVGVVSANAGDAREDEP
jgi:hypothetical protein